MKNNKLSLVVLALGLTLNFTSCSNDLPDAPVQQIVVPVTPVANGALVDGTAVTSTETPAMSDKTAVLKTTAGTFEMGFASKPTESGTYIVKSALAAKDPLSAAKAAAGALKEVTFKFTDKGNVVYKATDGAGGTVTIVIKDGKISIDISNINVCNGNTCKKVSVKYDFSYTPPVTPVDPIDPNPIDPNPNPNPTTGTPGTGFVNGVGSTSSFGTGMWVGNSVVFNTPTGSFQVWFKAKPTTGGTYTLKSFMTVIGAQGGATEVGFAYVPLGGTQSQLWSTDTSGGAVVVKDDGANWIIEAKNINACVNATSTCKTFSAFYKVPK